MVILDSLLLKFWEPAALLYISGQHVVWLFLGLEFTVFLTVFIVRENTSSHVLATCEVLIQSIEVVIWVRQVWLQSFERS